jgi:hypothetical protein
MLRFLRQIRQRLLPIAIGTENKFSKYLLYAVGEILLVVIGILSAVHAIFLSLWVNKGEGNSIEKYIIISTPKMIGFQMNLIVLTLK